MNNTLNKIGKDNFFIYDGFGNRNCQSFIRDILQSNGIYNDRIASFVFQPMDEFAKELGYTTGVSKFITDIGAFGSRLIGTGKEDGFMLHSVVVKKPATGKQLIDIKKEFIKGNKHFIKENKLSFKIRNIPKSKFIPSSYRTKKISKNINQYPKN